jgi:hypothetical protein
MAWKKPPNPHSVIAHSTVMRSMGWLFSSDMPQSSFLFLRVFSVFTFHF